MRSDDPHRSEDTASRRLNPLYIGWIPFGLVLLVTGLMAACSSVDRVVVPPVTIDGAEFVGNQSCADCHTNIVRGFAASPHSRFYRGDEKWAGMEGCESCHGAGSRHVAVGGGRGQFILNPGKDPSACFRCHADVHAAFRFPHHHPVIEGIMNCVQCHDPHGHDIMKPAGGLAMARLNESCAECHRDQTRPFVFEHEALREGCTVCHQPHGSIQRKLLVQGDNNLCLKCHAQMQPVPGQVFIGKQDHSFFLGQGSCWSAGCHTAVHGSNIHPRLFH